MGYYGYEKKTINDVVANRFNIQFHKECKVYWSMSLCMSIVFYIVD